MNKDANITPAELITLLECATMKQWDAAVDAIRASRGNHYPPDWAREVLQSGLHARVRRAWSSPRDSKSNVES